MFTYFSRSLPFVHINTRLNPFKPPRTTFRYPVATQWSRAFAHLYLTYLITLLSSSSSTHFWMASVSCLIHTQIFFAGGPSLHSVLPAPCSKRPLSLIHLSYHPGTAVTRRRRATHNFRIPYVPIQSDPLEKREVSSTQELVLPPQSSVMPSKTTSTPIAPSLV